MHAQAIRHPGDVKGTPPKHTLIWYKLLSIRTCFSLSTSGSGRHEQTQKSNPFHNCGVPSWLHLAKSTCHFLYKKEVHRYLPKRKSKCIFFVTGRKIRSKKSLTEPGTRSNKKAKQPVSIRKWLRRNIGAVSIGSRARLNHTQINFKVRNHFFVSNKTNPINKIFMPLIYWNNSQSQNNCLHLCWHRSMSGRMKHQNITSQIN